VRLRELAGRQEGPVVDFASRLIQTPSMSGEEGGVSEVIRREMVALGFDDVAVDAVGNVIGLVRGSGGGPSVMFNTHMDHVSPGNPASWSVEPFSGLVRDGYVWGRGATDIKGPLACQVHALGMLRAAGLRPRGDVYVVCVVMEEVGGLGTRHLASHLRTDCAVVGEPSSNSLTRGHRGRIELIAEVHGRSCHASMPSRGVNPHYALASFIDSLRRLPMADDPTFGASTMAPTLYLTDQTSANVIPALCRVHLDWRNVPGESPEDVLDMLTPLLNDALVEGSTGHVTVADDAMTTYTGYQASYPALFPAFELPADHPTLSRARQALQTALERPVPVGVWRFATDGGHLMAAGIPTIGFAPGEEAMCHVADERISIAQMVEALAGNAALALHLADPLVSG
jgi:putative selenium metabolism hydrolase